MVAIGKVGGLYGARGEVSLTLYDDFPNAMDIEEPVFVEIDEHTVPLFFETFKRRGQRGATVLFSDIDTEARALELVGLDIFLPSEEGEKGEFDDFVGWSVELREVSDGGSGSGVTGGVTGEVVGFVDGVNPLFEVAIADGENILIPAALVVEVDEAAQKIVFELPEGLLELNIG